MPQKMEKVYLASVRKQRPLHRGGEQEEVDRGLYSAGERVIVDGGQGFNGKIEVQRNKVNAAF